MKQCALSRLRNVFSTFYSTKEVHKAERQNTLGNPILGTT